MNILSPRKIECLDDLISLKKELAICRMNGYFPLYRGQAKDWTLLPSIARKEDRKHNSFPDKIQTIEKKVLQLMKRLLEDKSTKNFIKQRFLNGNYMNEQDWSLYFQARHLGLPTRLIDFTASIETASYFAVDSLSDDDWTCKNISDKW